MKLKLDLHDIYNRGEDIDRALRSVIEEAVEKKVRVVEIIPGKGSGQLKKRVLRFLDQRGSSNSMTGSRRTLTTSGGCSFTSVGDDSLSSPSKLDPNSPHRLPIGTQIPRIRCLSGIGMGRRGRGPRGPLVVRHLFHHHCYHQRWEAGLNPPRRQGRRLLPRDSYPAHLEQTTSGSRRTA